MVTAVTGKSDQMTWGPQVDFGADGRGGMYLKQDRWFGAFCRNRGLVSLFRGDKRGLSALGGKVGGIARGGKRPMARVASQSCTG